MAEIPLIKPNADSSTVVAPKTRFPLTVTSDENTEALSDVIAPTRSGAYPSIVTLPLASEVVIYPLVESYTST